MKRARHALTLLSLVVWHVGSTQDLDNPSFRDPEWLKAVGDRFAKCVGTYRGAAWVMRQGGKEEAAKFLEAAARGALLSAQFLLTTRADLEGKVLYGKDSEAYVEGVAYGTEGRFKLLAEDSTKASSAEMAAAMEDCTKLDELQTVIVQTMRESVLDQPKK